MMMTRSKTVSFRQIIILLKQSWICYLAGFLIVAGIKYYYSKAAYNDLKWILAPTAWWAGILSGISFENVSDIGFMNHSFRFIIAPSCSGVQFMGIAAATLIFSYVHRMRTLKKSLCWMAISLITAYVYTIFINGFRITVSIYLPVYLDRFRAYDAWLTPERLHTVIGTAIYFTSLYLLYQTAGRVSRRIAASSQCSSIPAGFPYSGKSCPETVRSYAPPVFWYFAIVLGVPFLNRAYQNEGAEYVEYAAIVAMVCTGILLLTYLVSAVRKWAGRPRE